MRLRGLLGDEQFLRDLDVGAAARHQREYLSLPIGERVEDRRRTQSGRLAVDEGLDKSSRDRGSRQGIPAVDCANRVREFIRARVLQ